MSTSEYARKRALQVAETNPAQAFDLVLAADEMDRSAARALSDPKLLELNKALPRIKTAAVKFLGQKTGLVWEASRTYSRGANIEGSDVRFFGKSQVDGPTMVTLTCFFDLMRKNRADPALDKLHVSVSAQGKGGRSLFSVSTKLTIDNLKTPSKWLDKGVEPIKKFLAGDLEVEKQRMLAAVAEAEESYKAIGPALKKVRSLVEGSTDLRADAAEIERAVFDVPNILLNDILDLTRFLGREG